MTATLTKQQMEFLQSMDTPTVCNVVEMVVPERRGHGYTVKHLFCPFPDLPPIVGFARTVTAKAKEKVALGSYMDGVVTNGSIRDIPMIAQGFQMLAGSLSPSHAYSHVEDFGIPVTVHGMKVNSGDLIHADQHGAVVVPLDVIDKMKDALDELIAREARIIKAAKEVGTVEAIKAAIKGG